MSYNESLSSNSNYPAMSQSQWDSAPWNESEVPEKEFDVTISQSLSKDTTVTTNNYVPGASGVDYEPDDEGSYSSCGWQDSDDTSDTDWDKVYKEEHYTPLQLLQLFGEVLQKDLEHGIVFKNPAFTKHLIEECSGWTEDETSILEN